VTSHAHEEASLHFIRTTWVVADLNASLLYADAAAEPWTLACSPNVAEPLSECHSTSVSLAQPAGRYNYSYFTYLLHRWSSIDIT